MFKRIIIWIIISAYLISCQNNIIPNASEENEVVTHMVDERLYDIQYIFDAPLATEKQDLSAVIKIVFTEGSGATEKTMAIDIQDKKIYLEPRVSTTGIDAPTGSVPVSDVHKTIELLEKHHVQQWKKRPALTADTYGWSLWLQFEDGTIEKYGGTGMMNEQKQSNYQALAAELRGFIDARVITIDPKPM